VQYQPTGCADICLQIPHWLVVLGSDQWPYRGHSGHLGHLLFDVLVRYALVKHPQRCHSAVAADTNSHHLIGPEFWVKPYKQVWGLEQYSWASALPDLAVCHFALWGFVLPMLLTIAFKYVHTHAHARTQYPHLRQCIRYSIRSIDCYHNHSAKSVLQYLRANRKPLFPALLGLVPLFIWSALCLAWYAVNPVFWQVYPIAAQTAAGLCIGEVTVRCKIHKRLIAM
jgi:hypothetical protein